MHDGNAACRPLIRGRAIGRPSQADVERQPGALRDRWPSRRDELWRDCGRASPGDEAGPAGADRPAPALAEGALAVSRVGPRAEFELQRAVRRPSAAGYRDPPTRHGLHEGLGHRPDPRPDDRGGLLSTFRGVRRGRPDGGDQRGAPEVVARAGPRNLLGPMAYIADRPLRPLGEAGGLRVRHGLQRRLAPSRRGSRRGRLATPGAQAEG